MLGDTKPLDIKPVWYNVIRRLQSVAASNHGAAIISISIVIRDDIPQIYTSPVVKYLEPKSRQDDIIRFLKEGEL